MTALLSIVVSASVVLTLGIVASALLRRRSAAVRHAIVAVAIVSAVCMPVFTWLVPSVPIIPWLGSATTLSSGATLMSDADVITAESVSSPAETAAGVSWMTIAGGLWLAGSTLALAGLLTGFVRLHRLRRRCAPVTGRPRQLLDALARESGVRRPVALLQSDDGALMITYGLLTPGIIVPADTSGWTDDRWHVVLRHELAHIARGDAALQTVSEGLRILQPWNPLVWIACRRLRQESEFACDDHVLRGGVAAISYAAHLLEVAKAASDRPTLWASAPAIAHPSTLERRITAMLNTQHDRTPFTRRGWIAVALAALCISLPLAAAGIAPRPPVLPAAPEVREVVESEGPAPVVAAPPARPADRPVQLGSITGRVVDQTGGVIPGASITLTDPQTSAQSTAVTNVPGRFTFSGLAPGEYTIAARLAGFTAISTSVTVDPGSTVDRTLTLPIGSLSETVTVACAAAEFSILRALFPVLEARQTPVAPIRVGGNVREPRKIKHVSPVCPPDAGAGEIRVTLTGRVGVDGLMHGVALDENASGGTPPVAFVDAALDAVRQWEFTPTELNGQPIEVGVTVQINFTHR
jgi:beta-lactamase regulating signal transducer with metallopeptidase domain